MGSIIEFFALRIPTSEEERAAKERVKQLRSEIDAWPEGRHALPSHLQHDAFYSLSLRSRLAELRVLMMRMSRRLLFAEGDNPDTNAEDPIRQRLLFRFQALINERRALEHALHQLDESATTTTNPPY